MPPAAPAQFEIVHSFTNSDGAAVPFGSVVQYDGWLYGTTQWNATDGSGMGTGAGAVYAVRPNGSDFRIVKSFTSTTDGANLFHGLTITDGVITGVTRNGGQYGAGTLFQVSTTGSSFSVLHHFAGGPSDGANPYNGPVLFGSTLYGLSFLGGANNSGVIYSYDRSSSMYSVRHSFTIPGGKAFGSLTPVGDWLYGMVSDHRSASDYGVIFRFRPADDAYEVVHAFAGGSLGGYPYDSLTWDGGHYLYGTTLGYYPFTGETAPLADQGVIFRFNVDTGGYEVIHDFVVSQTDGAKPNSSMLIAPDGYLYGVAHGTEIWGGAGYEYGTLYRLRPDGAGFEVLHTFDSMADGNTPMRALILDGNYLYGTTAYGGEGAGLGGGTVWRFEAVPEPSSFGLAASVGVAFSAWRSCLGRRSPWFRRAKAVLEMQRGDCAEASLRGDCLQEPHG